MLQHKSKFIQNFNIFYKYPFKIHFNFYLFKKNIQQQKNNIFKKHNKFKHKFLNFQFLFITYFILF